MKTIWNLMLDRIDRRRTNYHNIYTEILPEVEYLNEPVIYTPTTIIGKSSKKRYLLDRGGLQFVPDINIKETPSALARDYLYSKYPGSPLITSEQLERIENELFEYPPPLYAEPLSFLDGYYIDIASAYWSILILFGWEVDYYPSKWLFPKGPPPVDFPFPHNKISRNCLVSAAQSLEIPQWSPSKGYTNIRLPNPYINYQIMCLINDIMHGVACEAIDAGAIYVNTDGYIAPDKDTADRIKQVILDWGLSFRVHAKGYGWVNNCQSYAVGNRIAKIQSKKEVRTRVIKKLKYHSWLRKRVSRQRAKVDKYFDLFVKYPKKVAMLMGTYGYEIPVDKN